MEAVKPTLYMLLLIFVLVGGVAYYVHDQDVKSANRQVEAIYDSIRTAPVETVHVYQKPVIPPPSHGSGIGDRLPLPDSTKKLIASMRSGYDSLKFSYDSLWFQYLLVCQPLQKTFVEPIGTDSIYCEPYTGLISHTLTPNPINIDSLMLVYRTLVPPPEMEKESWYVHPVYFVTGAILGAATYVIIHSSTLK